MKKLFSILLCAFCGTTLAAERPNIVLIFTDTLAAIKLTSASGGISGRVHDALHLVAARKAGCKRIYTYNSDRFRSLASDLEFWLARYYSVAMLRVAQGNRETMVTIWGRFRLQDGVDDYFLTGIAAETCFLQRCRVLRSS